MNDKLNNQSGRFMGWNERYAGDDYVFGTEPNEFLKEIAHQIPDESEILCLADGEGRNGVYLAKLGHHVTSIDQSSAGLEKAQGLARQNKVELTTIQADLSDYDLGLAQWDCIVSIFFHIPPELQEKIYPRIIQSMKPDGLLILESYTPDQLKFGTGGPPVANYILTMELVRSAFGELEFLHTRELEREVIEGVGHTGHAAVRQLIAVKAD